MSNQSESFSWTAPDALERVTRDLGSAKEHPEVLRALAAVARRKGLDPATIELVSVALASEGNVVAARARRV